MLNKDLKPLLDLYSTTVFLCNEPIDWSYFSIITACNPNSELLDEHQNDKLMKRLCRELKELEFKTLIGASPDFLHQEQSFAVKCSKQKAILLAKAFQQNAIFWVEDGELSIEPAVLQFDRIILGRFSDRIKM